MKRGPYAGALERVGALSGVRGALVVAVPDGLIVEGRVHVGVHGGAVAALAASLYRRAPADREAGEASGKAGLRFVELEAEQGRIVMAGDAEIAILAVVERRANPGRVRLAVRRAADELTASAGTG